MGFHRNGPASDTESISRNRSRSRNKCWFSDTGLTMTPFTGRTEEEGLSRSLPAGGRQGAVVSCLSGPSSGA